MSHFSVLVVTDSRPSEDDLQKVLLPWHEFECTGIEEYLVDVDVTADVEGTFSRPQSVVVLADGTVHCRYDDRFYTKESADDFGRRLGRKMFELPAGACEEEWPADKAREHGIGYATIATACKEEYGGFIRDGRCYRRTNPNAKWDGWQIGGRYSGKFSAGYDPEKDPANQESCFLCGGTGRRSDMVVKDGCNGCGGTGRRTKWPSGWVDHGNQARVGELDVGALKKAAERQRAKWAETCCEKAGRTVADLDAACRVAPEIRAAWLALTETKPRGGEYYDWIASYGGDWAIYADMRRANFDLPEPEKGQTLADWIADAPALSAFAVVKDGRWYERGEMGWFACVSNEKTAADWRSEVDTMIVGLPADAWLTVVDCHI